MVVAKVENTVNSLSNPHSPMPAHKNKLTQCFDDIMKVAAEMMVQQQLKTVQLDPSVVNGFSRTQQMILSEKVHMFHAILDDLETTLDKSKTYVEAVYEIGKEKEKQKEEEREQLKRRQEEERKQIEELKRRQEMEKEAQEQQQIIPVESDLKIDFSMDTPSGLLADFADRNDDIDGNGINMQENQQKSVQTQATLTPLSQQHRQQSSHQRQQSSQQSPVNANDSMQQPTGELSDLSNMDISMFPGLENSGFDMSTFNAGMDGTKTNINNNRNVEPTGNIQKPSETNGENNSLNEAPSSGMNDNGDAYLTLNDFNDLNIDWTTSGDPADLDLNGFNI